MEAIPYCFMSDLQLTSVALPRALNNAGMSIAAKMAMMAMTTSNSMSVNDLRMRSPLLLQQEILQEGVERLHVFQPIRFAEDKLLFDGDAAG